MPRLTMDVDTGLARFLKEVAAGSGISVDEVVSRAVAGLALIRAARNRGLNHVGFVSDSRKLDAELRGLLPETPHLVVHS